MSDFLSGGWSTYIALVALVGIFWCIWLLFSQRKVTVVHTADGEVADTGHVWDGTIRCHVGGCGCSCYLAYLVWSI